MGSGTRILQVLKQNILQYCKNKVYYYIIVKDLNGKRRKGDAGSEPGMT